MRAKDVCRSVCTKECAHWSLTFPFIICFKMASEVIRGALQTASLAQGFSKTPNEVCSILRG